MKDSQERLPRAPVFRIYRINVNILSIGITFVVLVSLFVLNSNATAATITYTDRLAFETTLGGMIVDNYSDVGYNPNNTSSLDILSDTNMSSILGETDYTATGHPDINIIFNQDSDPAYCAGCNGSFLLGFTTTSIGDSTGVFGVGFDYNNGASIQYYTAYVTFGDSSTLNYALYEHNSPSEISFFGITSDSAIQSIHLGLHDGGSTTSGYLYIDNLTIGTPIPEPTSLLLLSTGLGALGLVVYRRKRK